MQRIRTSTGSLLASFLAVALVADASVASAQENPQAAPPRQDTPTAPDATIPEKTSEERPGPLDVVVHFQAGTPKIDVGMNAALDQTAVWLKEDSTHKVTIEIHPDETGRANVDSAAAAERAEAIRRYLVAQGAGESQIRIAVDGPSAVAGVDSDRRTVFIMASAGAAVGGDPTMPSGETAPVATEPLAPEPAVPAPAPAQPITAADDFDDDPSDDHLITPFGMALTVGGGLTGFLDGEAREMSDMGGAWEARLTLGTRTPLSVEAAYVGSAHGIDALGLDSDAVLLGTSVETDLRLNFTTLAVQPYIFGGIGYTRYDVTNSDFNTSSVNDDEEMGHIPLGAGVGYQWGGFLFDLRGTVRPAFNDDLVNEQQVEDDPLNESDARTDLDTWSLAARLGWEF